MVMDYKDNLPRGKKIIRSFQYAMNGIKLVLSNELNFKVHLAASIAVVAAGFIFSISKAEWLIIILLIAGMFALEMVNTAIERTVDLVTEEYHPLAGQAKDMAAGAVLCFAAGAVIIGLIMFLPKIWAAFM
ncbi:diacylglycerol kinase family protein [Bacillus salacetis]|uniref:Diacylglycerol kinase family protein n=1 Tax=Bacillus salacetis TaxID=2315464 RepID=A0A3A1R9B7_9BACI|nr:diacylglycerol kinase family protein [Bacillus salacetis]RIW37580.1 diacylglycerol kinase family protein [Bacillus salacetis]